MYFFAITFLAIFFNENLFYMCHFFVALERWTRYAIFRLTVKNLNRLNFIVSVSSKRKKLVFFYDVIRALLHYAFYFRALFLPFLWY